MNSSTFSQRILQVAPESAEEVAEAEGLVHLEVAALARATDAAIERGDFTTFDRCVALVSETLPVADPDLENALIVSFIENVEFEGSFADVAWSRFPPDLKVRWRECHGWDSPAAREAPRDGWSEA